MIPQRSASPVRRKPIPSSANRPHGAIGRVIALFKLTADHLAIGVVLLACPLILSGVALHLA